jgi:pantoate--beta-alanine ligase
MQVITRIEALRGFIDNWKASSEIIAFVPTMGNLHAGHIHLVDRAKQLAKRTVVSIFVNPMQFGPEEDFTVYPRTPELDIGKLHEAGADLLFMPDAAEIYPVSPDLLTFVEVPGLSGDLCGRFRPNHFRGVTTIVLKLFNLVGPDWVVLGRKDYQQCVLIERMVRDLNLPIRVCVADTQREKGGLALSSRNAYLSEEEKKIACGLYQSLCRAGNELTQGERNFKEIEKRYAEELESTGFEVDYFGIRNKEDLLSPLANARGWVILVAARLGKTRLIDNVVVDND